MSRKLTNKEVAEIVASEGLGYAIQDYLGANRIADHALAERWAAAAIAMAEVELLLPSLEAEETNDDD